MSALVGLALLVLSRPKADSTPKPLPAAEVIRQAGARAAREHKNVLVYFHASWCPWCKRTEKLLADPVFGPKFEQSYVLASIDIREREELRKNENPGWEKALRDLRGAPERDVPYLVALSPTGEKLGDSFRPAEGKIPGNAGFPRTPEEIEGFLKIVRASGEAFTAEDRVELKKWFQNFAVPVKSGH